jgi:hypothetical protein
MGSFHDLLAKRVELMAARSHREAEGALVNLGVVFRTSILKTEVGAGHVINETE